MAYDYNLAPKALSEQCAAFKKKYPTLDDLPADDYVMMAKYDGCLAIITPDGVITRTGEAITVRDGLIWRIHEYATLVREARPGEGESAARPAISRLGLSARQLGQLAEDLQEYFQRQRPFLDPDLDLQQVAAATGYRRNQISHLLNQVLGQSFYRYVNQARLQHLLDQLDAGAEAGRIDELAFAAGFNSLSAFYKCFRERTGMTPRAYLRDISTRAARKTALSASD